MQELGETLSHLHQRGLVKTPELRALCDQVRSLNTEVETLRAEIAHLRARRSAAGGEGIETLRRSMSAALTELRLRLQIWQLRCRRAGLLQRAGEQVFHVFKCGLLKNRELRAICERILSLGLDPHDECEILC